MQSLPQLAGKELAAKRQQQAREAAVRSRVSAETTEQLRETLARLKAKPGSEKWSAAENYLYTAGAEELHRREGLVGPPASVCLESGVRGAQAAADENRREFLESSFHFAANPSAGNYRRLEAASLAYQNATNVVRDFQDKAMAARAEESRAARAEEGG